VRKGRFWHLESAPVFDVSGAFSLRDPPGGAGRARYLARVCREAQPSSLKILARATLFQDVS